MEKRLTIETKNFWEIPGYYDDVYGFLLPLKGREERFCCNSFDDQEVVVYSVNGETVGYYQPSWRVAVFVDVKRHRHYCENTGSNNQPISIYLENFSNGVQWTAITDDGDEEEIFIQLL